MFIDEDLMAECLFDNLFLLLLCRFHFSPKPASDSTHWTTFQLSAEWDNGKKLIKIKAYTLECKNIAATISIQSRIAKAWESINSS